MNDPIALDVWAKIFILNSASSPPMIQFLPTFETYTAGESELGAYFYRCPQDVPFDILSEIIDGNFQCWWNLTNKEGYQYETVPIAEDEHAWMLAVANEFSKNFEITFEPAMTADLGFVNNTVYSAVYTWNAVSE